MPSQDTPQQQAALQRAPDQNQRWTPQLEGTVLEAIRNGVPPHTAMVTAGIPRRTVEMWMTIMQGRQTHYSDGSPVSDSHKAFLAHIADQIGSAKADLEAKLAQTLMNAGNRELISGGLDWRAHETLLKRHPLLKRDWAEHREMKVEHGGTISHDHQMVERMSHSELLDALPAEYRELMPPEPVSPA